MGRIWKEVCEKKKYNLKPLPEFFLNKKGMKTVSTHYKVNEINTKDNENETNIRILKGISGLLSKREATGRGCKKEFDVHERGKRLEFGSYKWGSE